MRRARASLSRMTLVQQGTQFFGTEQRDVRTMLTAFSTANAYVAQHFADAVCTCGGTVFVVAVDDGAGAATRTCAQCKLAHAIGDSADYLDEAELEGCACPCGAERFELTVGVSLYEGSDDVRWLYLGCRCPACGLVGCYGEWKNEYEDYRALLALV